MQKKLAIIGEAYGEEEELQNKPFVGTAGRQLDSQLTQCGINRGGVFISNLINKRPPNNDFTYFLEPSDATYRGLAPTPELRAGLETLDKDLLRVKPDVIIGLGNYPMHFLTEFGKVKRAGDKLQPTGIIQRRGSMLFYTASDGTKIPFIPTIHPAAVERQYKLRYFVLRDILRAVHSRSWTADYDFLIGGTYNDYCAALSDLYAKLDRGPVEIAVDVETLDYPTGRLIHCIGFATSEHTAFCVPFVRSDGGPYFSIYDETNLRTLIKAILYHPNARLYGHNFIYDSLHFRHEFGRFAYPALDTMLAFHLLQPTLPKALYSVASLYCEHFVFWKDDGKSWLQRVDAMSNWRYNCMDVVKTFECAQALKERVKPEAANQQEILDLIPFAYRCSYYGLRIDTARLNMLKAELAIYLARLVIKLRKHFPYYNAANSTSYWFDSPAQTASIFYNVLGCAPVLGDNKKPTVDADAIRTISQRDKVLQPLCATLLEYREHLKSLEFCNATMHERTSGTYLTASIDLAGTTTFRFSTYGDPFGRGRNLQNISEGD